MGPNHALGRRHHPLRIGRHNHQLSAICIKDVPMKHEKTSNPQIFECQCGVTFQSNIAISMPPDWHFQYGAGGDQWLICGSCHEGRLSETSSYLPGPIRAGKIASAEDQKYRDYYQGTPMAEIGPSRLPASAIIARCNRIIDHAKYVQDLCINGKTTAAEKWIDAIIREADLNDEWVKGEPL
jgi:hypothetical protein